MAEINISNLGSGGGGTLTLTTTGTGGASTYVAGVLNIPVYQSALTNPVTGTGTATRVAFWDSASSVSSSANLYWDDSNSRLGVGAATPGARLQVNGSGLTSGTTGLSVKDSGGTDNFTVADNGATFVRGVLTISGSSASNSATLMGRTSTGEVTSVTLGTNLSFSGNTLNATGGSGSPAGSTGQVQFNNAGAFGASSNLFWDNTNTRLGIGTSTPASPLNVFRSTDAEIRSSVTNAFCSFTAFAPLSGYPRSAFLIGNSSSDVNTGLVVAPFFDDKQSFLEIRSYKSGTDSRSRNSLLYNHPTSGFLIGTNFGDGNTGGLPIVISTRDYGNAYTNPAIYINTFANSQRVGINSVITNGQLHVKGSGSTSGTWTAQFHNSGNTNNALMVRDDGIVAMGTASPNASARLDITSTTQGVLLPRMTTTDRGNIASPADGLTIYNTTTKTQDVYNNTRWLTGSAGLTGSATLDFGSTAAQTSSDLTITVTGAADGDIVSLGVSNASVNANTNYTAWVSAANTVTVRFNNYSSAAVDPASGTFKVFVTKFS